MNKCENCRAYNGNDCVIPSPELGCPNDNIEGPLKEWILDRAEKQISGRTTGAKLASLSIRVAGECEVYANCEPESVRKLRAFVADNFTVVE